VHKRLCQILKDIGCNHWYALMPPAVAGVLVCVCVFVCTHLCLYIYICVYDTISLKRFWL